MKLKIIEHYDGKGLIKGYTLAYKPIPFIPYWKEMEGFYESKERMEHDVCWLLSLNGVIDYKEKYEKNL